MAITAVSGIEGSNPSGPTTCRICLSSSGGKEFCSKRCRERFRYRFQLIEVICQNCSETFLRNQREIRRHPVNHCRKCVHSLLMIGRSGPKSPTWKGGHKSWQAGKRGIDKEGLHWTQQRLLCWERDHYTCQDCGKKKGRKPDCHHKVPYRVLPSHALDNLISLCQSCHKRAEAKCKDLWNGETLGKIQTKRPVKWAKICAHCNRKTKKLLGDQCSRCHRLKMVIAARTLREKEGLSYPEISDRLGLKRNSRVWHWCTHDVIGV